MTSTSEPGRDPTPVVVVRGDAHLEAAPDEVEIAIELNVRDRRAERASEELARRSTTITQLLDELAVPGDRRSTTGVLVREEREWEKSRMVFKGYRAWMRLTLRLTDFTPIPAILSGAVGRARHRRSLRRGRGDVPPRVGVTPLLSGA